MYHPRQYLSNSYENNHYLSTTIQQGGEQGGDV